MLVASEHIVSEVASSIVYVKRSKKRRIPLSETIYMWFGKMVANTWTTSHLLPQLNHPTPNLVQASLAGEDIGRKHVQLSSNWDRLGSASHLEILEAILSLFTDAML